MESLARYVIRAPFSQERITYVPDESKVVYKSKDGKDYWAIGTNSTLVKKRLIKKGGSYDFT